MGLTSRYSQLKHFDGLNESTLYRGVDSASGDRCIIQTFGSLSISDHQVLTEFFSKLSALNSPSFKWRDFQYFNQEAYAVFADNGGLALSDLLKEKDCDLLLKLSISLQLCSLYIDLCREQVELEQVQLSDLLYNQSTGNVRLVNLSVLRDREPQQQKPSRSLQSLGELLFSIFSGYGYHESQLGVFLGHHILPGAISDILESILSPEGASYHSLWGVRHDLELCLAQFKSLGVVEDFKLKHKDIPDNLELSSHLFAREDVQQKIKKQFERICHSGKSFFFISGESGIGKTVLASSLIPAVNQANGIFLSGKFDSVYNERPYHGFAKALESLTEKIQSRGRTVTLSWKKNVLESLGENISVIVQLVPSLESIFGEVEGAPELPPQENAYRFQLVIQQFLAACANIDSPLILFLDDIQWIDHETLVLLKLLQESPGLSNFLFVGTYRCDNLSQQKNSLLDKIVNYDKYTQNVELKPFSVDEIKAILSELMKSHTGALQALAEYLETTTGGNPFYLESFLRKLVADDLIFFDYQKICWQWDMTKLSQASHGDSVIDFVEQKVNRIQDKTKQVLQLASCFGNEFFLDFLAQVYAVDVEQIESILKPAVNGKLIVNEGGYYRFYHDNIYTAIYKGIPEEQRDKQHYDIGNYLTTLNNQDQYIFLILSQLNRVVHLIQGEDKQRELIQLNLKAACLAKDRAAYSSSHHYLKLAIQLVQEKLWQEDYSLAYKVYLTASEVAYLSGDFEASDALGDILLQRSKTLLDKVGFYEIKIQSLVSENKQLETIELGCYVLNQLLGESLPAAAKESQLVLSLLKIQLRLMLSRKTPDDLSSLPPMEDVTKMAAMRIYAMLCVAAYRVKPSLFPLIALKMVSLSLKYGQLPESSFGYAVYGVVLSSAGLINRGFEFSELVLKLCEKPDTKHVLGKSLSTAHFLIRHWKVNAKEANEPLLFAHKTALETGDVVFAAVASLEYCANLFFTQAALDDLESALNYHARRVVIANDPTLFSLNLLKQCVENLKKESQEPYLLKGGYYDEEDMLPQLRAASDHNTLGVLFLYKIMLSYWFGHYTKALSFSEELQKHLGGLAGMTHIPVYYFYDSLVCIAVCQDYPEGKKALLKRIAKNQKKLKRWAKQAPMNYLHKSLLVDAELNHLLKKNVIAEEQFEEALKLAKSNQYLQDRALISERMALFMINRDKPQYAKVYLIDAYHLYQQWGAAPKADILMQTYAPLLKDVDSYLNPINNNTQSSKGVSAILQVSHQLASTLYLPELFDKFVQSVNSFLDVNNIVLILKNDEQWVIENTSPAQMGAMSCGDCLSDISHPVVDIIDAVLSTGEKAVMYETQGTPVSLNSVFASIKSLACLPIHDETGQILGALYLDSTDGVIDFDTEALDVLNNLNIQLAISVVNARKFDQVMESGELKKFVSGVVHDVRNPLHSVIGLANMLTRDQELEGDMRTYSENITTAAETALKVVNDLMDYSKVNAGHLAIEETNFDLNHVFKHLDVLLAERIKEKNLDFSVSIAENAPRHLIGDSFRLGQVLTNLVSNAVKFTDEGAVRVDVSVDSRDSERAKILFAITDTGIGIVPEKKEKLFDAYFQADASVSRKYGGTGLGLSICKNLVELMNGNIWVESTIGVGSTFYFTVDVKVDSKAEIVPSQPTKSQQVLPLQGKTILVVDDEDINLLVAEDMISELGADVDMANSGDAAIEIMDKNTYDLVLIDLNMKDMKGNELAELIRSGERFSHCHNYTSVPLVCLSASVLEDDVAICLASGMNDFVKKPIKSQALLEVLSRWLLLADEVSLASSDHH